MSAELEVVVWIIGATIAFVGALVLVSEALLDWRSSRTSIEYWFAYGVLFQAVTLSAAVALGLFAGVVAFLAPYAPWDWWDSLVTPRRRDIVVWSLIGMMYLLATSIWGLVVFKRRSLERLREADALAMTTERLRGEKVASDLLDTQRAEGAGK